MVSSGLAKIKKNYRSYSALGGGSSLLGRPEAGFLIISAPLGQAIEAPGVDQLRLSGGLATKCGQELTQKRTVV